MSFNPKALFTVRTSFFLFYVLISCFSVKMVWPSKVESYLKVKLKIMDSELRMKLPTQNYLSFQSTVQLNSNLILARVRLYTG